MSKRKSFLALLKAISVEPAMIFSALSLSMYTTASNFGMYRVMCDKVFKRKDNGIQQNSSNNFAMMDCWNDEKPPLQGLNITKWWWYEYGEDDVQHEMATYSMLSSLTTILPSVIANIILGAYGDRAGRKGILLLSLLGHILRMVPDAVVFSDPDHIPLFVLHIGHLLASLTGTLTTSYTASAAYLSDTVEDEGAVSLRMTMLLSSYLLGMAMGPPMASALTPHWGYLGTVMVAMGFGAVAMFTAMIMVRRVEPRGGKGKEMESGSMPSKCEEGWHAESHEEGPPKGRSGHVEGQESDQPPQDEKCAHDSQVKIILTCLKEAPDSLLDAWRTVFKERPGHRRSYILIGTYITCITASFDALSADTVFTLFLEKDPLSLTQNEIASFNSVSTLINLAASTFGMVLFKKVFGMSDILVTVCALVSYTAGAMLLVFSDSLLLLYLSSIAGCISSLAYPCLQAVITRIVDPDEIGKALGVFALSSGLFYFIGSFVAEGIYKLTVEIYPQFIFVLSGGTLCSALVLSVWLHCGARIRVMN